MKKIKLAVLGSRTFEDCERLYKILDANIDKIEMIVSGGAAGADSLAQEWCKERGVPILIYYPRWHSLDGDFNRGAGFKRNYYIISACDKVLAFWDGSSRGTANSLSIAKELNKSVKLLYFIPTEKAIENHKQDIEKEGDIK